MLRVRTCDDFEPAPLESRAPQLCHPVCRPRPASTRRAGAGETLFPNWDSRRVLEERRAFAKAERWRVGERIGAHSLGRGAVRAIQEAGGSVSQLPRSGQWLSALYRLLFVLGREGSRPIVSVPIEAPDGDATLTRWTSYWGHPGTRNPETSRVDWDYFRPRTLRRNRFAGQGNPRNESPRKFDILGEAEFPASVRGRPILGRLPTGDHLGPSPAG